MNSTTDNFILTHENSENWVDLFEKPLAEILSESPQTEINFTTPVALYSQALKSYLLGNPLGISEVLKIIEARTDRDEEMEATYDLALLRLFLRTHDLKSHEASTHIKKVQRTRFSNPFLEAERNLTLGQVHEASRGFQLASEYFLNAYQLFHDKGCPRRAFRAKLNSLTNLSCLFPDEDYIAEYISLADASLTVNEDSTAAICWLNISREFQKNKNFDVALSYCTRALLRLTAEKGTLNCALAECHQADLLIDLQDNKAETVIEELKKYPFPQVKENVKVLESKLRNTINAVVEVNYLLPTWRERWASIITGFRNFTLRGYRNE